MSGSGLTGESLTSHERGQWFLHQIAGDSGVANLGFSFRVAPQLRWWPTREALGVLVGRHAALRQRFPTVGGMPVRQVAPADRIEVPLDVHAATDQTLWDVIGTLVAVPFDLATGPLLRASHILVGQESVLVLVSHHIALDGLSIRVLAEEFLDCYEYLAEDKALPESLTAPVPVYQPERPSASDVERCGTELASVSAAELALDGARALTGSPTFAGDLATVSAPGRLLDLLATLRAQLGATDGMVVLAVCAAMLHRHGAGDDLVVGVPVNLRRGREAARAVGFHVATVPVRFRFTEHTTFRELAGQARAAMLGIFDGRPVSFEHMLEHLGHRDADWRAPVFRHMINLQATAPPAGMARTARDLWVRRIGCRVDLEFMLDLRPGHVDLQCWYSTEVHDRAEVEALLRRITPLFEAAYAAPDAPLAELDITSERDRAVLGAANDTAVPLQAATLLELMRAQDPASQAIVAGSQVWTYAELVTTADQIAARLAAVGVGPGQRVALVGQRGPRLAAAILACWALAAAYVPLDPALPPARAAELIEGTAATVIPDEPWPGLPAGRPVIEAWAMPGSQADGMGAGGAGTGARPSDPAVVVYTSGTTARPKGVVVGHLAMLNVVRHFADLLGLLDAGQGHRVLWSTTFAFDVSALELLVPLTTGGAVVVANDEQRRDPGELLALIARQRVDVVQATPTLWRDLVAVADGELAGVQAICGGEPLTAALAGQLVDRCGRVFNAYGPTETTIWSTVAELAAPAGEPVVIGRPIANTIVEVRDDAGRVCPPGVVGELVIGGTGLAVGYLDQPDLTAERFVGRGKDRRYRTGDRARWRADGVLVLHGRTDRQIKLRGHRIELGEVEAVLEQHQDIRAAAVCTVPGPHGDEVLAAFVRPAGDHDDPGLPERLWRYASTRLPLYEVPGRFVPVGRFPLTVNGKVDHRQLARDAGAVTAGAGTAPGALDSGTDDPLIAGLVDLWRDLLGAPELGPDANFFLNGGHSLLVARLLTEATARLDRTLSYEQVFAAPTPARLADLLRREHTPEEV